ncbi:hypothetical protein K443DRAFT_154854 [Laccaria amethystina LaAM-08-1]|uniref:Uncharacterized protein n=1 Tax=Laccaria amethystina LaAM-08-1 TaxID=1095629 RepID=A0A0C9WYZ6_9AGAR|nr:hypothetical protein K443DRAFT_154854 [Laccaria amethystina LaAM-08-1]
MTSFDLLQDSFMNLPNCLKSNSASTLCSRVCPVEWVRVGYLQTWSTLPTICTDGA